MFVPLFPWPAGDKAACHRTAAKEAIGGNTQKKLLGNETMDHTHRGAQSHIPSASKIRETTRMIPLEIGLITYPQVTQLLSIKFL